MTNRRLYCMLALALPMALGPAASAVAQQPADAERTEVYENPQVFSQLSGAMQSLLERKYGAKPAPRPAFSGAGLTDQISTTTSPSLGALSPLANILVNNPSDDTTAQDTQSETAIVLGAGKCIVSAFNDSGSLIGGASKFTGFSILSNSGSSFEDQGTLPTSPDGDAGDPVLARSAKTGTILLSTLAFTSSKLMIFRSEDNGKTFKLPVNGAPGFTAANGSQDKEWLTVDNHHGAGFGNVYMCWRNFAAGGGLTFTRSLDDGKTWGPNMGVKITNGVGQGAFVTVGSDHTVYIFWFDQSTTPSQIKMVKSTDQGASFGSAVKVTDITSTGVNGDLGLSPGFRSNCFPQAVGNPRPHLAKHLYVIYPDHNGADHGDIFFRRSIDAGATWSAAVRVNNDMTTRDQWQPALVITPNGTRIAIAWYDRRNDPANLLIDRYGVIGKVTPAGVSFASNFRITNQSFPPVFGVDPVVNGIYMGDYDQLAADNSHFYTTWGDNRDNSTGHAGKNANLRFARFGLSGATFGLASAPTATATLADAGDDDDGNEIAIADLPSFVTDALASATAEAPSNIVEGNVKWLKAMELGDGIRMFRVQGKDKDGTGKDIEAEVKGNRVIELETRVSQTQVPDTVASSLKLRMPGAVPDEVEVIVVAGKVVGYGFEPKGDVSAAAASSDSEKTEIYLTPEGKVMSRSKIHQ